MKPALEDECVANPTYLVTPPDPMPRPLPTDTKATVRIWNDYQCHEIVEAIAHAGYEVRARVEGHTWHVAAYLGRWRLRGPKASGPSQHLALSRLLDRVRVAVREADRG